MRERIFLITLNIFAMMSSGTGRADTLSLAGHKPFYGIDIAQADHFWEKWHLVTVRYRKDNDQLRTIYANDVAWGAIVEQKAKFPDGSMFAKTVFNAGPDPVFPASLIPAGIHSVQFMKKDAAAYADTDGWGFALSEDGPRPSTEEKKLVTSCHACHQLVKDKDFVFSRYAYGALAPSVAVAESPFALQFKDKKFSGLSQFAKESVLSLGPPPSRLKVFASTFFTGQRTAVGSVAQFATQSKSVYLIVDESSRKFLVAAPIADSGADCKNGVRFRMSPEGFTDGFETGKVCDGKVIYNERNYSPAVPSPSPLDDRAHWKSQTVTLENFVIDKPMPAMSGPVKSSDVEIHPAPGTKRIWIKGMDVDVLNAKTGEPEPLSYLCHGWIESSKVSSAEAYQSSLLSISEGMGHSEFPAGFGLALNPETPLLRLSAQALNENPSTKKNINYKLTVFYLEDNGLAAPPMQALQQFAFEAFGPAVAFDHDGVACGGGMNMNATPDGTSGHFLVPPGRHTFTHDFAKGLFPGTRYIHYIKMHLHRFGESIVLKDKTTGEVLWKGRARYKNGHIQDVDFYSDRAGIAINPDHEYQVVGEYNNWTKKNADGMAVLRTYISQ